MTNERMYFTPGSTEKSANSCLQALTVSQDKTVALNRWGGQSETTIQWAKDLVICIPEIITVIRQRCSDMTIFLRHTKCERDVSIVIDWYVCVYACRKWIQTRQQNTAWEIHGQ